MDLEGRRVLITGASQGVGKELAKAFFRRGARVVLVARRKKVLADVAEEMRSSEPSVPSSHVTVHPADLTNPHQVDGLIERVESDARGHVDVLVNNAGLAPAAWFASQTAPDIETLFRVNVLAPMSLCHQAIPGMLERRRGHIVNVSSIGGVSVLPGLVAYSVTKAAITHLTAGLRADLRGLPIDTTVVELGPVATGMLDEVKHYEPTANAYRRLYKMRVIADLQPEVVARRVVDAVRKNKRHVRLSRRAAPLCALAEMPRRAVEIALAGVAPSRPAAVPGA